MVAIVITAAALMAAVPAPAMTAVSRSGGSVIAGNARFQVLSPTLIRSEYAGDGRFTDAATFNAVGRSAFTPPPYTTTVAGGRLTIRTSAVTVEYQLGSGPFDSRNFSVRQATGTATPWRHPVCATGSLCEAEDLTISGLAVATDHSGDSGGAFVAGFEGTGASVSADADVTTTGDYQFDARYANAVGGDGQHTTRTLTLTVDGAAGRTVSLPPTPDWNSWATAAVPVHLTTGRHTITLARAKNDSGNVNVDSVALVSPGAPYPATTSATACRYGTTCEAEAGTRIGDVLVATDHGGFSGKGFVAELIQGTGLSQRITGVPADGTYALQIRYANGTGGDGLHQTRTATVSAGGVTQTLSLPATSDWDSWATVSVPVTLKAGAGDVTIGCPDAISCHINADTVSVTAAGAAAPAPHLALGGYRRGLDGFNGANGQPKTTPGLLYQDGWYLLDDTATALYDTATRRPSPRPAQQSYQDGYVFAYGHDYQRALSDLATLTGPPLLLPRWAYGVWYSEYIDRTAADYRDTILPAFRANRTPLDVLVTDTDFKSPSTWNGWEMDSAKYPDPKAFFDWSAAQGLHNTLNIHPSILDSDPQFAAAQATAHNKLTKNPSCGNGCYTFDWGDPDQLKAYLNLHADMDRQGNDFWWLDWCCDASTSSLSGVGADAWINQQYATAADKTLGRGFVISRAYGSLQAGGYGGSNSLATGPWADKRASIHFTGDTSSNWATLSSEVGYTPGEAAATGMSAISHDIGGHNDTTGLAGAETYTVNGQAHRTFKLPDDLYARWVQLGTFQPVDRLHSNHSDRLPWQYGPAAQASAEKFLNLRENLVAYTYTLAQQAASTGVPVTRPTYLQYPEEPNAYTTAGSEYFYGPDLLVAPVTTPGTTATTSVWFPPGTTWTDYFTGKTYAGGTTQAVTTDLAAMPVFVRAGGIVPTRTADVTNDVQNPLDKLTVTVAGGGQGTFTLYDDNGTTTSAWQHATTTFHYSESAGRHTLRIDPARGFFPGQAQSRQWTISFRSAAAPAAVLVDGRTVASQWDEASHELTVTLAQRSVYTPVTVAY